MANATFELQPQEWRRVRRFVVVGVSSTALDFALLSLLKTAGLSTLLANSLAFSIATVYNFFVSRTWTYRGAGRKPMGVQFSLFLVLNLMGLVLNDGLVVLLETPFSLLLGHGAAAYLPAKVIATGAVAVWSYLSNRLWVFPEAT